MYMGIINELWVIHQDGRLLYNQKTKDSLDAKLFSNLLSAIVKFAENLKEGSEIKMLTFGNSNFVIIKSLIYQIIFVGKASSQLKEKKITKSLVKVKQLFLDTYGVHLLNWAGETVLFADFASLIDLSKI